MVRKEAWKLVGLTNSTSVPLISVYFFFHTFVFSGVQFCVMVRTGPRKIGLVSSL